MQIKRITDIAKTQSPNVVKAMVISASLLGFGTANAMLPTPAPEASNLTQASNTSAATGIQSKTVAAVVKTDAQGRQTLQPINTTTQIRRGDTIEYRSYITNTGSNRVGEMTVTMSIPKEVTLLGGVSPSLASASLDGVQFGYMPLQGQINGQVQEVPLKYYRQLRWTIEELDLNETAMVSYRAIVR